MSMRRTLRVGPYGSNQGLKEFIENSSFVSQNGADRYSVSKEGNKRNLNLSFVMKKDLSNLNRSFVIATSNHDNIHSQLQGIKTTSNAQSQQHHPIRGSETSRNAQRQLRSMSTSKKMDEVTLNKNDGIDHSYSQFLKGNSYTPQKQQRLQQSRVDISRNHHMQENPHLNSDINVTLLNEQKIVTKHISNDKVAHEYVASLRTPNILFQNKKLRTTITRPFSIEHKYDPSYKIKHARDFKVHHEKFLHLQRHRIGVPLNVTQANFDMHLREYQKEDQYIIEKEKKWTNSPSRNLLFVDHQSLNKSFVKTEHSLDKSGSKDPKLISISNVSYIDYPSYDEKILRKNYPLLRELKKDKSFRKQGDLSQSNLKWELSLNSYSKYSSKYDNIDSLSKSFVQ